MTTGGVYTTTTPVGVTNYTGVSSGSQVYRGGESVTYTTGGPVGYTTGGSATTYVTGVPATTTYVTGGPAYTTSGYNTGAVTGSNVYQNGAHYGETVTYSSGPVVTTTGENVTYVTSGGSQVRGETVTYTNTNGGYVTGGSGVRNVAY